MSYSIIQADIKKHKADIISLWNRNFREIKEARYPWIYEKNPSGLPICYLLKHDDTNSVVGLISLFPRSIYIKGKNVQAYICGDLVVDKKHRTFGPALFLFKAAISKCEEESSILISFPNKISEVVSLRAGFKILGELIHMTQVLRTYPYVMRYVNFPFLARAISYLLDLFYYCLNNFFRKIPNSTHVEILEFADNIFDDFGKKIVNDFSLKGEVSSTHLNWRFHESPYNYHKIFVVSLKDRKNIIGYIVFYVVEKRVQIVDFSFDCNDKSLDILFTAFSNYQIKQGAESIGLSIAGSQKLINQLKKNGYLIRFKDLKFIIYVSSRYIETISEIKSGNWYLTLGDNDV